jgi:hypothetical protein
VKRVLDYKIYYSDFELDNISNFFTYLSYLALLNSLLNKKLITKSEYEKVKCMINSFAQF